MSDIYQDGKICYSKFLSALFSSLAMLALSILCLLNHLSLDLFGVALLIKVVVPGALSFWILGYIIGKKLDGLSGQIATKKIVSEKEAYEIPSMFGADVAQSSDSDLENLDV